MASEAAKAARELIGRVTEPESRPPITFDEVARYAYAVDDARPAYIDGQAAKDGPYGGIVAPPLVHGVYQLSADGHRRSEAGRPACRSRRSPATPHPRGAIPVHGYGRDVHRADQARRCADSPINCRRRGGEAGTIRRDDLHHQGNDHHESAWPDGDDRPHDQRPPCHSRRHRTARAGRGTTWSLGTARRRNPPRRLSGQTLRSGRTFTRGWSLCPIHVSSQLCRFSSTASSRRTAT